MVLQSLLRCYTSQILYYIATEHVDMPPGQAMISHALEPL